MISPHATLNSLLEELTPIILSYAQNTKLYRTSTDGITLPITKLNLIGAGFSRGLSQYLPLWEEWLTVDGTSVKSASIINSKLTGPQSTT
jgi:hypothetical protein